MEAAHPLGQEAQVEQAWMVRGSSFQEAFAEPEATFEEMILLRHLSSSTFLALNSCCLLVFPEPGQVSLVESKRKHSLKWEMDINVIEYREGLDNDLLEALHLQTKMQIAIEGSARGNHCRLYTGHGYRGVATC